MAAAAPPLALAGRQVQRQGWQAGLAAARSAGAEEEAPAEEEAAPAAAAEAVEAAEAAEAAEKMRQFSSECWESAGRAQPCGSTVQWSSTVRLGTGMADRRYGSETNRRWEGRPRPAGTGSPSPAPST